MESGLTDQEIITRLKALPPDELALLEEGLKPAMRLAKRLNIWASVIYAIEKQAGMSAAEIMERVKSFPPHAQTWHAGARLADAMLYEESLSWKVA